LTQILIAKVMLRIVKKDLSMMMYQFKVSWREIINMKSSIERHG